MEFWIISIFFIIMLVIHFLDIFDRSRDRRLEDVEDNLKGLEDWYRVKIGKGFDPEMIHREYVHKKHQILAEQTKIIEAIKDADDNEMWG